MRRIAISIYLLVCSLSIFSQTGILDSISILKKKSEVVPDTQKITILSQAQKLAADHHHHEESVRLLFELANIKIHLSDFAAALEYTEKGNDLIQTHQLFHLEGQKYMVKGDILLRMRKWKETNQEYQQAAESFSTLGDSVKMATAYNGIGLSSYYLNQKEKAFKYLKEAVAIMERHQQIEEKLSPMNNLATTYLYDNQPSKALPYYESILPIYQKSNKKLDVAQVFGNIAYTHSLLKNYSKAFDYYNRCIEIAKEGGYKETEYITYLDMSDTYKAMGDYKNAYEKYKAYQSLKAEVDNVEVEKKMAELEVKYEAERNKKTILELQQQTKIDQQQRWLLYGGILTLLMIGVLVYVKLKANIKQEKIKQQLTQSELKIKIAEEKRLKEQLAYKNKDITNLSLDIVRKNDFSITLKEKLDSLVTKVPPTTASEIRAIQFFTDMHLQTNEDLATLQINVAQVNQAFYQKLLTIADGLSQTDKQLCGLLRLNLSSKEIAVIRNITPKSVKMARYRLRKKLGLDEKENIVTFLQNI